MKHIVIILFFLSPWFTVNIVNAQCRNINSVYWEQINDSIKKETITSRGVSIEAVNYYKGYFRFTDNEKSFQLLDTLTSEPEQMNIKALYFYLFNKICAKADGAVAEELGNYCQKIVINDPIYVLNYFSSNNSTMKTYAQLLGYELYFKENGTSDIEYNFNDFKKLIKDKIDSDINLQKTFNDFNKEIEEIMKNMD